MKSPRKITLRQAAEGGAVELLLYCADAPPWPVKGCAHTGRMRIEDALARWGEAARLDELPLVCSQCGGRKVDVRPGDAQRGPGGRVSGKSTRK